MAKSGRETYRVSSVDDILRIPDMRTARDLMKEWNLETKGIKSRDEALQKLMDFWNNSDEKPKKQKKDAFTTAIGDDKRNRQELSKKYDEVLQFYHRLSKQHQADLDNFLSGVEKNIDARKKDLLVSDCTILIAGETSAGKSSFVNLLLGTDILPTSNLRCTSTVCEIRNSSDGRKYAVLYYKSDESKKKKKPETIGLEDGKGLATLSKHVTMFDEETEESPYSRIEVFWPVPILSGGMVIVDTPGIGGSKHLSKCVERYLAKSFGFIYIINSASAGGVQKGRLQDFLRLVVTSVADEFNPRATMFVCNKWDTVPVKDREDVRNTTFIKLERCYPGVREDQIYRISVDEALKAAKCGSFVAEHTQVLEGIQTLLPASLRNQLGSHYRWLSQVLKRSMYSLKVSKLMDVKGIKEKEETAKNLQKQMDKLDRNAKHTLEEMRAGVKYEIETLQHNIIKLLSSSEMLQHLCHWEPQECPPSENWRKVAKEAEMRIADKISFEITMWDRDNGIVKGLKDKIVKKFKRDFEMMEDQMREIEGILLPGEARVISDFQKSMKRPTPVKHIFAKAGKDKAGKKQDDTIKRIGAAVSSSGLLDAKAKDVRSIFRSYNKANANFKMGEATQVFIESITDGKHLKSKLDNFLGRYIKGIDDIAKMIPDIVKADRDLLNTLSLEMSQTQKNMKDMYPTLLNECAVLQGRLDMLYVIHIMETDYRLRDLHYDRKNRLGSGSFADVYKGTLKKSQGSGGIQVALKISKDPLNVKNVSDILLEDNTMRDLQHENIVKYYGAVLSQDSRDKLTWIMILEFCKDTLKGVFIDEDFDNPGKIAGHSKIVAMKDMSKYVIQICSGLQYLHSKDLVHRDLKLENVLISSDNVVKLTDVGLTKGQRNITGTIAGSPVYMAPEVLVANDIYNFKADIYSLAIMLWEMWYGIDAAEHIQHQIYKTLEDSVLSGLRPSLSIQHRPPEDWEAVIVRAWEKEPAHRPEAKTIKRFFEDFFRNN